MDTEFLSMIGPALMAGILSFLTPCVLPLVPAYLGFLGGASLAELKGKDEASRGAAWRVFWAVFAFVLGFATILSLMGAGASLIGQWLAAYRGILGTLAGVLLVVLGLHFLGVFRVAFLNKEARFQVKTKPTNVFAAYVVGLAFAFGWTPCLGPAMAGMMAAAGATGDPWVGGGVMFFYAVGIGGPFLLAAAFAGPFLQFMQRYSRYVGVVEKIMGVLLVITGVLFLVEGVEIFGVKLGIGAIAEWMLDTFPIFLEMG